MILRILKISVLFFLFSAIVGITAYLTLSFIIKGEDTVIIPDLYGKDAIYALEILSNLGLNTKVKGFEYSSKVPKNNIILQEPMPGEEVKKGRDVRIIISKGDKTIIIPNLKGFSVQQAHITLEENDLHQGILSVTYSEKIEKDGIIAQYPLPGALISRGGKVNVLTSLGNRVIAYKMPDFTGYSLDDAILLVEKNKFAIGEIKSIYKKDMPKNVIVGQEPRTGERVTAGSKVNLVINRKTSRKGRIELRASGVKLFKYKTEIGFLKHHIQIRLNCFGASIIIYDGLVEPGEEIWLVIPNNMDSTVSLFEDNELIKTRVYDSW